MVQREGELRDGTCWRRRALQWAEGSVVFGELGRKSGATARWELVFSRSVQATCKPFFGSQEKTSQPNGGPL